MLEVERLLEAEATAAGDPNDANRELEDLREGLKAELPDESSEESDDSDNEPDTTDPQVVTESLHRVHMTRVATEDVGEYLTNAGKRAFSALGDGLAYLGHLGIAYGPTVLRKAYKGVLYATGRIAKLTYLGYVRLDKYIERRGLEIGKLQAEVSTYRQAIQLLRDSEREISSGTFGDDALMESLAIDGKLDWFGSLDATRHVLNDLMIQTSKSLLTEIAGLRRQVQEFNPKTYSPDNHALTVRPPRGMAKRLSVTVGDAEYDSYQYPMALPGNRVAEWRMPVSDRETTDVQRISFTVNVTEPKPLADKPSYMQLDDLSKYLDKLEGLCSLMQEQQKLYSLVKERRSTLRGGFKLYLNRVLMAESPVHIGHSMLDVVYMRSVLIDRVYLSGMMDLQDAVSRIVRDSLYVVKRHVRNHASASETE